MKPVDPMNLGVARADPRKKQRSTLAYALSAAVLTTVFAVVLHADARATTFTVITTGDSGAGSLRAAITAANMNPGADTISFSFAGTQTVTIAPQSGLPLLTDPVTVDGTTHLGPAPTTKGVEIDGAAVATGAGFTIAGGTSTIKGLAINRFEPSRVRRRP
jgi:hypothetical protein